MAKRTSGKGRPRGSIERRGNSLRVQVYAGVDPLTGKRLYLRESTTDEKEAERILTRLTAQVDEQRHAKTRGTVRAAFEDWLRVHEIEESTLASYEGYLRHHIGPAFGDEPIGKITPRVLEQFYAELRRCSARCDGQPFVEHRIDGEHECREVRHRRPPGRPPANGYPPHDCDKMGCKVIECQPHECTPLSSTTINKIHFALSGAFSAAVRWGWISTNPADVARKPKQPAPSPKPPTAEQAAQIIEAAWSQDSSWGTLVWLVMVTGMRRGEVVALRWNDVDLSAGRLEVRRSYGRVKGKAVEKATKTHQMRLVALDELTVEVLTEHWERYESTAKELGEETRSDAFLFSHDPSFARPYDPDRVTHRYHDMCKELGIDSHLHALRHYSATSLIAAGVDPRTVAGRLGHGGGGATTLRVYTAWVGESDRRAADILGRQMKRPEKP